MILQTPFESGANNGATPFASLAVMLEHAADVIDRDIALARERIAAVRDMLLGRGPRTAGAQITGGQANGGLAAWQERRVAAHIDANLEDTIGNDELAAIARLSTGHFCRAFRQTFGTTPHAYVMQRRVARASTMMIHSSDPLASIAAACGFTDQAHLSRLFRRIMGNSPAIWRRQNMPCPVEATV